MSNFEIVVASVPDRDELTAELYYKGNQWVEISHETDEMLIQFYPHPSQDYWEFSLKEALHALEKAKQRMIALGPKHPTPLDARCVDIEKYEKHFEGGILYNLSADTHFGAFTMESASIDPKTVSNCVILSDQNTLKGKLSIEEIESITVDEKTIALPKDQTFKGAIIQSCVIRLESFELDIRLASSTLTCFKVRAKKIYWENFPTQSLEEIKTDAWRKKIVY